MISLAELQRRIESGELSPDAAIAQSVEAIAAHEKTIGAFVCRDENVRAASPGPLRGIAVGIKDIIDTADFPTEMGSQIYRGHQPRAVMAPVAAAASIPVGSVTYAQWTGGGEVDAWVRQACTVLGIPSANWLIGYRVLCRRESSGRANAINHSDSNAHGALQADGFPLHCSRGVAQCIPDTFAAYHAAGTSTSIYDPIANIAASMRYVMSRYGVRSDGSNLTFEVQQADANRSPRGY